MCSYKCTAGCAGQIFNYTYPFISSPGDNCSRLIRIKTYSMTLKKRLNASLPKSPVLFGAIRAQQLLFASEREKTLHFHAVMPMSCFTKTWGPASPNPTVQNSPAKSWCSAGLWCKAANIIREYHETASMKGPAKTS